MRPAKPRGPPRSGDPALLEHTLAGRRMPGQQVGRRGLPISASMAVVLDLSSTGDLRNRQRAGTSMGGAAWCRLALHYRVRCGASTYLGGHGLGLVNELRLRRVLALEWAADWPLRWQGCSPLERGTVTAADHPLLWAIALLGEPLRAPASSPFSRGRSIRRNHRLPGTSVHRYSRPRWSSPEQVGVDTSYDFVLPAERLRSPCPAFRCPGPSRRGVVTVHAGQRNTSRATLDSETGRRGHRGV